MPPTTITRIVRSFAFAMQSHGMHSEWPPAPEHSVEHITLTQQRNAFRTNENEGGEKERKNYAHSISFHVKRGEGSECACLSVWLWCKRARASAFHSNCFSYQHVKKSTANVTGSDTGWETSQTYNHKAFAWRCVYASYALVYRFSSPICHGRMMLKEYIKVLLK